MSIIDVSEANRAQAATLGYEISIVVPTYCERANVIGLVARLKSALGNVRWQVIFVDDASPDGTAEAIKAMAIGDPRISCLRRVGRRGLAGAVMEGALASAARFVLVIDADGQHDERLIPAMLMLMRGDQADVVVASRYLNKGDANGGLSRARLLASRLATRLVSRTSGAALTDPMSGFFIARRGVFDDAAPFVTGEGFKVLYDLLASSKHILRVKEVPLIFQPRAGGESKFDLRVGLEYLALVASHASHNLLSPRALIFAAVGASGVVVHMTALRLLASMGFKAADLTAALVAMTSNYMLNNAITYRDKRRTGWLWVQGYARFAWLCSLGLVINIVVALFAAEHLHAQNDLRPIGRHSRRRVELHHHHAHLVTRQHIKAYAVADTLPATK